MSPMPPCPVCDNPLEVRPDKRGHPFLFCRDCTVNTFVHRKEAVAKFKDKYGWTPEATPPAPIDPPEPVQPPAPTPSTGGHRARKRGQQS